MAYAVINPTSNGLLVDQPGESIQFPVRKRTQEDQDKEDNKARKAAERNLEKLWMDRLQLISVITTFFAATEAQMLSMTTPISKQSSNTANQVANAGLSGALVFHAFAAIFSFTAVFVLIQYRLEEAQRKSEIPASTEEKQIIWSRDPHIAIEHVRYFRRNVLPIHLLQRFYILCISMSVIGFVLATGGVLCFVWVRQATSVSVFSTASFGGCVVAGLAVLLMSSAQSRPE